MKKRVRHYAGVVLVCSGSAVILQTAFLAISVGMGNTPFAENGALILYRIMFWSAATSLAGFLAAGGQISRLRLLDGFPYKE